jgi:uncharacterized LabA/DUF88 family protein
MSTKVRVQAFVDGFNLYHAIQGLNRNHLKWVNLRSLTASFTDPSRHELREVFYFSAFATWLPDQLVRHRLYVEALKANGVTPVLGQFKVKDRMCKHCGHKWIGHEEKETDVNIALWLLREAYKDNFDEAFVISRDSDLTPAVRMVMTEFPDKEIKIITPPNARHSKEMAQIVGDKKLASIKVVHLERNLLPATILSPETGLPLVHRPPPYDPPALP